MPIPSMAALQACKSAAADWSPLDLADLLAFWHAPDLGSFTFSSGSSVSAWADLTDAYTLAQATSARQPTRNGTQNGETTVTFDGGDMMSLASITYGTFTIYVAGKFPPGIGLIYEHSDTANSNNGGYLNPHNGATVVVRRSGGASSGDAANNWAADSTFTVLRHQFDGTDAGHTTWRDSVEVESSTGGSSDNPGTSTVNTTFNVGARAGLVAPIGNGSAIGSLIVCSTSHDSATAAQVEDWLRNFWGTP